MYIQKYLIINSRGSVTIRERTPKLNQNEIAVKITLQVPNALFTRPILVADMRIPNEAVPKTQITPQITNNIENLIRQVTGLEMVVSLVEKDEK